MWWQVLRKTHVCVCVVEGILSAVARSLHVFLSVVSPLLGFVFSLTCFVGHLRTCNHQLAAHQLCRACIQVDAMPHYEV